MHLTHTEAKTTNVCMVACLACETICNYSLSQGAKTSSASTGVCVDDPWVQQTHELTCLSFTSAAPLMTRTLCPAKFVQLGMHWQFDGYFLGATEAPAAPHPVALICLCLRLRMHVGRVPAHSVPAGRMPACCVCRRSKGLVPRLALLVFPWALAARSQKGLLQALAGCRAMAAVATPG